MLKIVKEICYQHGVFSFLPELITQIETGPEGKGSEMSKNVVNELVIRSTLDLQIPICKFVNYKLLSSNQNISNVSA